MEYVYGYRTFDCRNNIRISDKFEKIIYHTSSIGVAMSLEEKRK